MQSFPRVSGVVCLCVCCWLWNLCASIDCLKRKEIPEYLTKCLFSIGVGLFSLGQISGEKLCVSLHADGGGHGIFAGLGVGGWEELRDSTPPNHGKTVAQTSFKEEEPGLSAILVFYNLLELSQFGKKRRVFNIGNFYFGLQGRAGRTSLDPGGSPLF